MISFLDPEPPPRPVGELLLSVCDVCGGTVAVRDYYVGPVRCAACWSAHYGTDPLRPIAVPAHLRVRYAGGNEPSPPRTEDGTGSATGHAAGSAVSTRTVPPPYRVLIPAREATASQIPPGAAVLLAAARSAGREVRATYALAEERATGRMVHSCAVRVKGVGYATWWDGTFHGASGNMNQAQFLAAVTGEAYLPPAPRTPPPTGPCPRCGRPVRWKTTSPPAPYRHQRELGGEGGRGQKVTCE